MNVNAILDLGREFSGTNATQYPNTTAIKDLNKVYRELCADIMDLNNNYFWREVYADTVAGQYYYTFPIVSGNDVEKLTKVYVKYTNDGNYVEARAQDYRNYEQDPVQLADTQDLNSPIYVIEDTTFSIFPAPPTSITNGLKVHGIMIAPDLTVGGAESDILFKPKYHDVLRKGLLALSYRRRQLIDKAQQAEVEFQVERAKMLERIVPRNLTFEQDQLPDLTYLTL